MDSNHLAGLLGHKLLGSITNLSTSVDLRWGPWNAKINLILNFRAQF